MLPLTLTVNKSQKVLLLGEARWKASLIPLGAIAYYLPVMLCLLQGPASTPPPSPADKAEQFISVTSHKSNHQLTAHYLSPDRLLEREEGDG